MERDASVTASDSRAEGSQYLTFQLGDEEYGIEILKVQEIKGLTVFTPIPNAPPHLRGVMNLRGAVVPVIDLRRRFSMPALDDDKFSVVIVVTVGARVYGVVVDAVSDVVDLAQGQVEEAPELGAGVDTSFLRGMARAGEKFVLLLDIDRLLGTTEEIEAVAAA